jgi:signal transduction histidine kinase
LKELADHALHDLYSYKLDIPDPIPALPAHLVHHLRMIAQEAITNALKHAHPTMVTISLQLTDGRLALRIADNGRGFDPNDETHGKPGHFGCIGIRERCRRIHAEATWQSKPEHGTSVTITLPLANA